MDKELTPEMLEISDYEKIFIRKRNFEKKEDEIHYYRDLVYGLRKLFGLSYIYDEEIEKNLSERLSFGKVAGLSKEEDAYSDFAREFYLLYTLAKENFGDNREFKTTKEMSDFFTKKRIKPNDKKYGVWQIKG